MTSPANFFDEATLQDDNADLEFTNCALLIQASAGRAHRAVVFGQRGNAELRARESRRERGALRWIHDAVTNASVTAAVAITSKVARRE